MKENEIEHEYAHKIVGVIQEMLNGDIEDWHIDKNDLLDDKKATAFLHALANLAPAYIYTHLTGDEQDMLGFNHIANRMCFQFSKKEKE